MRRSPHVVAVILCATLAPRFGSAATVTPLVNLNFMGGQNFFDGKASSVSGNADALVTPVVKFSDRWSLFPTYHGYYQGTQEVQSLAGGGTLFRDSTGQALLLKSVHTWGAWKLKPSVGATLEWLRETRDEGWGQGLFDHRKYNGGVEAEYDVRSDVGARLAYDYYRLDFPNYKSLESAQDPTLSRELTGEKVLNNTNHMATLGTWAPLPGKGRLDLTGMYDARLYGDQPLVNEAGQLIAKPRRDTLLSVDAALSYPFDGPFGTKNMADLGLRYGSQNSNQDHYDANKTVFQSDYYDYTEWRVAPELTTALDENRWWVTLGGSYERRDYGTRPTQDADGNYLGEKLNVTTLITHMEITHPLSPSTKLRFDMSLGWSDSNTGYEDVFRYNYRIASYGMGFSYVY